MRVGEVGQGWTVAMTTLMNERVALGDLSNMPRGSGAIRHALRLWETAGADDPVRRDRLVELWIRSELTRLTVLRAQEKRERGTPGPEGAVGKLAMTLVNQATYEFITTLAGTRRERRRALRDAPPDA